MAIDQADVVSALRAAGCVFAEDEAHLLVAAAGTAAELADLVDRRVAGLPLERILGWAEFRGLRILIDPGVFVPRRRTEFLVEQAAAAIGERDQPVVLDLCCGSGAVGVALSSILSRSRLYAADIDPAAVRCAGRNVKPVGGRVFEGDLFDPLPDDLMGRVDILAVNAPYVPTAAIGLLPPEARIYEPAVALDGGRDGLEVQRRVVAAAPRWLAPGGQLLMETSDRQAELTAGIFSSNGLTARIARSANFDATIVIGAALG